MMQSRGLTALLVAFALFFLASCRAEPMDDHARASTQSQQQPSPPVKDPPPTGRFVFYPDSRQALPGGHLLDTATGDMWVIGYEPRPDGKLGGELLLPIERRPHPQHSADPLGIR